jgi:hypothetical protein
LKESFAEDFTAAASGENLTIINAKLNNDMARISKWAASKKLKISSRKFQFLFFTPNTREHRDKPEIYYEGELIPVVNIMKILGINLDTGHNGSYHEDTLATKGPGRLPIVKAVSSSKSGFSKEDGLIAYKAFIPPIFSSGAPVWFPIRSKLKEPVKQLQVIQNDALRAITGNHSAASIQHLHDECKILPVKEHLSMQCAQFLVSSRHPCHPSHEVTGRLPGVRPDMKPTLQRCFGQVTEKYALDGTISELSLKRAIKEIHTDAVSAYLEGRVPNCVLGTLALEVHPDEALLPRIYRTTMTPLRADFNKDLRSYQKFIHASDDDSCPGCHAFPHTTAHLFSCSSSPTALRPIDLWNRPLVAASFLSSLPSFAHLPPLVPPRPPPEPPPPGGAGW